MNNRFKFNDGDIVWNKYFGKGVVKCRHYWFERSRWVYRTKFDECTVDLLEEEIEKSK